MIGAEKDEHQARLNRERQARFVEQRKQEIELLKSRSERLNVFLHHVRMCAMDFAEKPEDWLVLDDEALLTRVESAYTAMAEKANRPIGTHKKKPVPKK
jgi:hypothetical protein